jgi:hypothetical protein
MSIYSDELVNLTAQLVTQVGQLQQAISINDNPGISTAANAIAATITSINQTITSTDVPPDDTMVFFLANDLQTESDQLQQAITAVDNPGITAAGNALNETTVAFDQCVDRMGEWMPSPFNPSITTPPV